MHLNMGFRKSQTAEVPGKACFGYLSFAALPPPPTKHTMALNVPWIALRNDGKSLVFVGGFVLGILGCLICRFVVDYAHRLRKCGIQDDKTHNVDTAEKGSLKKARKISLDEDLFSLEKRAFFSQVCKLGVFVAHIIPQQGTSQSPRPPFGYQGKC